MLDSEIIALYWSRQEQAIAETQAKYGSYCQGIAWNILRNRQDTEECVNDTWLRAWNAMPPQRPNALAVFLGTITRHLSLDRWRATQAKKRGSGQLEASLSELDACVPASVSLEERISQEELGRLLDRFLRTLPLRERCIFIRKYWYTDSILDIARRFHMTESAVKVNLHRSRNKLRQLLEQEGFAP